MFLKVRVMFIYKGCFSNLILMSEGRVDLLLRESTYLNSSIRA